MTKARDIADGTRYVDVTGDTMTGQLDTPYQVIKGDIEFVGASIRNTRTDSSVSFIDAQNRTNAADSHIFFRHLTDGSSSISFGTQPIGDFTDRRIDSRMYIDGNGRVTKSYQPAFYAYGDGGATSMTNSEVNPVYNSVAFNTGNYYNTTTGVFTAPVGGIYYFAMGAYMFTNSGYNRMRLQSNIGILHYKIIPSSAVTADHTEVLTGLRYLAAGDTCYPTLQSDQSNAYFRASNHSWFEGYLLG